LKDSDNLDKEIALNKEMGWKEMKKNIYDAASILKFPVVYRTVFFIILIGTL